MNPILFLHLLFEFFALWGCSVGQVWVLGSDVSAIFLFFAFGWTRSSWDLFSSSSFSYTFLLPKSAGVVTQKCKGPCYLFLLSLSPFVLVLYPFAPGNWSRYLSLLLGFTSKFHEQESRNSLSTLQERKHFVIGIEFPTQAGGSSGKLS